VRIESAHGEGTLIDVHLPYQAASMAAVDSPEY
jgi:hypothetical protein